MLLESKRTLSRMSYSSVTQKLTFHYSNGDVVEYSGVPDELYEEIRRNGKVVSDAINEKLGGYKMTQMV